MIDLKRMGENIRRERKRQLLTIEHLAERAGISDNFLGKIERGESMPSLPTIDGIAQALGVTIDALTGPIASSAEHSYITAFMELNALSKENKERFMDFINTNIKYFK